MSKNDTEQKAQREYEYVLSRLREIRQHKSVPLSAEYDDKRLALIRAGKVKLREVVWLSSTLLQAHDFSPFEIELQNVCKKRAAREQALQKAFDQATDSYILAPDTNPLVIIENFEKLKI